MSYYYFYYLIDDVVVYLLRHLSEVYKELLELSLIKQSSYSDYQFIVISPGRLLHYLYSKAYIPIHLNYYLNYRQLPIITS